MDCFYAAIEVRDKPELAGKPVAVGGARDRRGVLTTCNYEARKFGVRSAMPTFQALQRCPELIVMPTRFEVYRQESAKIREILFRFTPLVEPLSLDEAFLDVSRRSEDPATLAENYSRTDFSRYRFDRFCGNRSEQNVGQDCQRLEQTQRPIRNPTRGYSRIHGAATGAEAMGYRRQIRREIPPAWHPDLWRTSAMFENPVARMVRKIRA